MQRNVVLQLCVLVPCPGPGEKGSQGTSVQGALPLASLLKGFVPLLLYQPLVARQELCQHLL